MAKRVIASKRPTSNIIKTEEDLANFIKYKRTNSGSTIKEMSDMLNINSKTLSKMEIGKVGTRLSTAIYVANMLGLEIIIREKSEKNS